MNYFLSGGAKNGKSSLAQRIVCAQPGPRYYLATMIPHDDEDLLRIQYLATQNLGVRFSTDYDVAPPVVRSSRERLHKLTFSMEVCAVF